jgi:hypothetical protein
MNPTEAAAPMDTASHHCTIGQNELVSCPGSTLKLGTITYYFKLALPLGFPQYNK